MPQPLSRVNSKIGAFSWGGGAFDGKPEFAILAANIIAASSYVDHELGMTLGRILKADTDAALAIYETLQKQRMQKLALEAAAKVTLSDGQYKVFQAVLSAVETAQAERHRIAHWVWGNSPQLPEAMLLFDPSHLKEKSQKMEHFSRRTKTSSNISGDDLINHLKDTKFDYSNILVYKVSDLQRAERDINEAGFILSNFRIYIDPIFPSDMTFPDGIIPEDGTSESALRRLSTLRLFREAHDHLNARARKNQQSPPQSPEQPPRG